MSAGETPATRFLTERDVDFERHLYDYEAGGGAPHAADCLGVTGRDVVKTLVMQDETDRPLLVLMHGDQRVSMKKLRRAAGAKRMRPCSPDEAKRATGYVVGGISPFGTRQQLAIYAEESIFALDRMWINGGRRGLLLEMSPQALERTLNPRRASLAATPAR